MWRRRLVCGPYIVPSVRCRPGHHRRAVSQGLDSPRKGAGNGTEQPWAWGAADAKHDNVHDGQRRAKAVQRRKSRLLFLSQCENLFRFVRCDMTCKGDAVCRAAGEPGWTFCRPVKEAKNQTSTARSAWRRL